MNDLEYLNQISAGVQKPAASSGFFDKKMKPIVGIFAGVILLLIVLAIALGSSSTPEVTAPSELSRLYVRAEELTKTINTYNGSVRSSSLRSTGASFSTLLAGITTTSTTYLTNYGVDPGGATSSAEDTSLITDLNNSLENARLNGILDRNYASEMYYQIRYLLVIEESIYNKTSDSSLKSYLESSSDSLSRLGNTFYNFSESN